MTTLMTRIFRGRCVACQVGQGRPCQCEGAARVCNGRRQKPRLELPAWVLQLAIYGGSVAVVVGLGAWLWGWCA